MAELLERPLRQALAARLVALPRGRRLVALTLIGGGQARTYAAVAELLGLHPGTVRTHLERMRQQEPEAYRALMAERKRQLVQRHEAAAEREAARSRTWHKRQANRRYYYRFGCWPWDRCRW